MPNLNDFLSQIQTDHGFYSEFRLNPEQALASYELTTQERITLTESREQLRARLGQLNSYLKTSCTHALLGSGELGFDVAEALGRPEIRNTIGEIRMATADQDRLPPVLALMEQIG